MNAAIRGRLICVAMLAISSGACASVPIPTVIDPRPLSEQEQLERPLSEQEQLERSMARAREAVPASPDVAQPSSMDGTRVWREALLAEGLRVLVGTESRSLWLMRDTVVLFRAPVAVGMSEGFTYEGRTYDFTTPTGRRRVQAKATAPLWVPPDWHYFEIALERDLEIVRLKKGQRVSLGDDTYLEVRGEDVGRINQFGNFWPFTPGSEIIFDGKVYIPPFGTRQRQIPEILGTHKLELGDGYLIHGTNQATSIGDAVSHGCVRMYNADVEHLYAQVPVGTPVFIF
ncbi:MAG TPA: L,D-transpeptidase [Longimicrobiales bacterium]|nr:L,D-transpeptidase [Longimicrobiales bacterium]